MLKIFYLGKVSQYGNDLVLDVDGGWGRGVVVQEDGQDGGGRQGLDGGRDQRGQVRQGRRAQQEGLQGHRLLQQI